MTVLISFFKPDRIVFVADTKGQIVKDVSGYTAHIRDLRQKQGDSKFLEYDYAEKARFFTGQEIFDEKIAVVGADMAITSGGNNEGAWKRAVATLNPKDVPEKKLLDFQRNLEAEIKNQTTWAEDMTNQISYVAFIGSDKKLALYCFENTTLHRIDLNVFIEGAYNYFVRSICGEVTENIREILHKIFRWEPRHPDPFDQLAFHSSSLMQKVEERFPLVGGQASVVEVNENGAHWLKRPNMTGPLDMGRNPLKNVSPRMRRKFEDDFFGDAVDNIWNKSVVGTFTILDTPPDTLEIVIPGGSVTPDAYLKLRSKSWQQSKNPKIEFKGNVQTTTQQTVRLGLLADANNRIGFVCDSAAAGVNWYAKTMQGGVEVGSTDTGVAADSTDQYFLIEIATLTVTYYMYIGGSWVQKAQHSVTNTFPDFDCYMVITRKEAVEKKFRLDYICIEEDR